MSASALTAIPLRLEWSRQRRRKAWATLARFGRPHRALLVRGGGWTVFVVLFRLAMPWPLRAVMELVFKPESVGHSYFGIHLSATAGGALWLCGAYLVCAIGVGYSEMGQRVSMTRFAAQMVSDLRAQAVGGASRAADSMSNSGDLIARLIGDTARLKAGLSGVLVHFSQNALLFGGVTAVMLSTSWRLGLFFLVGGLATLAIGLAVSVPVGRIASRHRQFEGAYASLLHSELSDPDGGLDALNIESHEKDVRTTRMISSATLLVHVVLGLTTALALLEGIRGAANGTLAAGEVFVFIAYALVVHRRMVQVGRQTARLGKVFAAADRLTDLVGVLLPPNSDLERAPISESLRLEQVKVAFGVGRQAKEVFKSTDLALAMGERVFVTGKLGSGKPTLLRVIAGIESPTKGQVFCDGEPVADGDALRASVAYLPHEVRFAPQKLWRTLGLAGPGEPEAETQQILEGVGAWSIVQRHRRGLELKASSVDFSASDAHQLKLAELLIASKCPVWVLETPLEGLGKLARERCLETILRRSVGRLLVLSSSSSKGAEFFSRVVAMRKGSIVFDGSVSEWTTLKDRKPEDQPEDPKEQL